MTFQGAKKSGIRGSSFQKEVAMQSTYQNFEKTFVVLLEKAKKGPVSLQTLLSLLSGKGRILLLIFLSLGFGQIPGVAFFLGLLIGYLGVRIAMGNSWIWVPRSLLGKKIPSYLLVKIVEQILRFLRFMKRWSHPRYGWATQHVTTRVVNGLAISLVGLFFAISPPVPLSGLVAFAAIFSIAIGLLNDDGIYLCVGYSCSLIYFAIALCLLKFCSVSQMIGWLKYLAH